MHKRIVAIRFCHLKTDWMMRHQPHLKNVPFVLQQPDHGRMRITEVSAAAQKLGLQAGMVVADAKVIVPGITVLDEPPGLAAKLLAKLALWCIRYTPVAAVDQHDGLLLDATGCAHLWGGEQAYLKSLLSKLKGFGYHVRAAMADTAGAARAVARYGRVKAIVAPGGQHEALALLPPAALLLPPAVLEKMYKLGFHHINSFAHLPRTVLRRRFGEALLLQLDEALGLREENLQPILPPIPYEERLPCIEPISTRKGIEIALQTLLDLFCKRLQKEGKGIRAATFKGYRTDDKVEAISIRTSHPSHGAAHLFKLFQTKVGTITPALGIELFTLEAQQVEDVTPLQETFWSTNSSLENRAIAQLVDALESKFGAGTVHRYLPDEHYLPERSIRLSSWLGEQPAKPWNEDKWRPMQLLRQPQPIEVSAPIPDYPPMNFRYQGRLHVVKKADACERIEAEWWLDGGLHRDYYIVENERGKRYWVFRLGHYDAASQPAWFMHGFFA